MPESGEILLHAFQATQTTLALLDFMPVNASLHFGKDTAGMILERFYRARALESWAWCQGKKDWVLSSP